MTEFQEKPMKILLADDHNIVRQGIRLITEELIENPVFFQASSLDQIRKIISVNQLDIAILDAQLPDGNCISILPEIRRLQPSVKILIFTSFDEENYSIRFISAGANGFLSKLSEEDEIRNAISNLIEKGEYYPPLTQSLIRLAGHNPDALNPLNQLSERELEIAILYAKGFGNLEISNRLSIRQNTVSTYKKRIFEKLKIGSIVELIELIQTYHNF